MKLVNKILKTEIIGTLYRGKVAEERSNFVLSDVLYDVLENLPRIGRGVSGGYQALFRFELPACYHPNLVIFWGVWLFQKKNSSKIRPYASQITF